MLFANSLDPIPAQTIIGPLNAVILLMFLIVFCSYFTLYLYCRTFVNSTQNLCISPVKSVSLNIPPNSLGGGTSEGSISLHCAGLTSHLFNPAIRYTSFTLRALSNSFC